MEDEEKLSNIIEVTDNLTKQVEKVFQNVVRNRRLSEDFGGDEFINERYICRMYLDGHLVKMVQTMNLRIILYKQFISHACCSLDEKIADHLHKIDRELMKKYVFHLLKAIANQYKDEKRARKTNTIPRRGGMFIQGVYATRHVDSYDNQNGEG